MEQHVAFRVEDLGKRYRIGRHGPDTLREIISRLPRQLARNLGRGGTASGPPELESESFWALRHVSFEVAQGEILGLIGPNGAGKSTLLRILSRISFATEGRVSLRGEVRSLLEVGTGFHPELTGRENVYLNGAVLGIPKREIEQRFDEIVEFSGVSKFLDTPVKRYSSGMHVRLGFAVAVHLKPDILLVDEVLAVGDVEFQRRCLNKVKDVVGEGRTVVLVSHNMQQIRRLCTRAILLREGELVIDGDVDAVIGRYLVQSPQAKSGRFVPHEAPETKKHLGISYVELLGRSQEPTSVLLVDESFKVCVRFKIWDEGSRYKFDLLFRTADGVLLSTLFSLNDGMAYVEGGPGESCELQVSTTNVFLAGSYTLDVVARTANGTIVDSVEDIPFFVENVSLSRTDNFTPGVVRLQAQWALERPGTP